MRWLIALALLAPAAAAQRPEAARWIWGSWTLDDVRPEGEVCCLRREVLVPAGVRRATCWIACDDHFELRVNGRAAGRGDDWRRAVALDVAPFLRAGANVLAVRARNGGGPAGLLCVLEVSARDGRFVRVVSDAAWTTARGPAPGWDRPGPVSGTWEPARELGPYGAAPWGAVPFEDPRGPAARFRTLPGFRVQTLARGTGSLLALAQDEEGGVIVSLERGGLLRLTDGDGDGTLETRRTLSRAVTGCQGLCVHRGAVYAVGRGPAGPGLYRVPGEPDAPALVGALEGGGEHGPHAVVPGPDGRLWVALGNHSRLRDAPDPASPYRLTYEGHLLPRLEDPRGHARGVPAPGGVVVSVDPDARDWRVHAGGFRNAYDVAFDGRGRLFAWDSDMEWDVGLPWYRPAALYHVLPGGEYGWRRGSTKWPFTHRDALPPVVSVGRGSPTGLVVYRGSAFPRRFRGAILGGDWSRGRVLAFHLAPRGISFTGTTEVLLSGRPLNVTDLAVDAGGGVLLVTGGRGTAGGVHRLVYDGPSDPPRDRDGDGAPPAAPPDADAPLPRLLAALGDPDRCVRFLAGRALERRPAASWTRAVRSLADPLARAEGLLALARAAQRTPDPPPPWAPEVAAALVEQGAGAPDVRLAALRALELLAIAAPGSGSGLGPRLLALFPAGRPAADRLLATLLSHHAPPGAARALLDRLARETSRAERLHLALCLAAFATPLSAEERRELATFVRGARAWAGGHSFRGYVAAIADLVAERLPPGERSLLEPADSAAEVVHAPAPAPDGRAAVRRDRDVTARLVERALDAPYTSAAEGGLVYVRSCAACHPFAGIAGSVGPDLTGLAGRFTVSEMLDAVLHPSRHVSDQYRAVNAFTRTGGVVTGLPVRDDGAGLVLLAADGRRVEIPRDDVIETRPSAVSSMPEGLLDHATPGEIGDLVAFLASEPPLPPAERSAWRPLFGLDGPAPRSGAWRVAGGVLTAETSEDAAPVGLLTEDVWTDFVLELEAQVTGGTAGIRFRAGTSRTAPGGYVVELGSGAWGSLRAAGGRLLHRTTTDIWRPVVDAAGWNHVVVLARGKRLRVWLNGALTCDLDDGASLTGRLGLHLPGRQRARLRVRNARVRRHGGPR